MVKKNTCVFISGKGSNLRNLILRSREYIFPIKIKLIISNHKNAEGILYAKKYSIPYLIVNTNKRNFENIIFFFTNKIPDKSHMFSRLYEDHFKGIYTKISKKNN